jgi:hypothetical protein
VKADQEVSTKLVEHAQLAQSILHYGTPYAFAKKAIRSLFSNSTMPSYQEMISLRLTVIDSYYSTNMNKRYYGIEDISSSLQRIAEADAELESFFLSYIRSPKSFSRGVDLFNAIYGIDKSGDPAKRAQSLISKYAYFVTNFRFPIYDSLAKKSYQRLSKTYPKTVTPCKGIDDVNQFFQCISELNLIFKDFDLMDNLLWLIGKVKEGNLSLIIIRADYEALMSICNGPLSYHELVDISENNGKASSILGQELVRFIQFVKALP